MPEKLEQIIGLKTYRYRPTQPIVSQAT